MDKTIAQSERLDIFLALATYYHVEPETEESVDASESIENRVLRSLSALDNQELNFLKSRIRRFELLTTEKQKVWQTFRLEKLKNRGRTNRLESNIHPEQIAEVLKDESASVCKLILSNLPTQLAERVKSLIDYKSDKQNKSKPGNLPTEEISLIVRNKFLSNFISFEDIYKPNSIDELSANHLEKFIRNLGIREIAITCRGMKTKENMAVFLKPFDEKNMKEIVLNLAALDNVTSKRVNYSEKFIRRSFENTSDADARIEDIGTQLLAITFISRTFNDLHFTIQKLPIKKDAELNNKIAQIDSAEAEISEMFAEITTEILELAINFKDGEK